MDGRILDDASQQPVVMPTVPNLVSLFGDSRSPLLILPQRVQLWRVGEKRGLIKTQTSTLGGGGELLDRPQKNPSNGAFLTLGTCEATIGDIEHEALLGGLLLLLSACRAPVFGTIPVLQLGRVLSFVLVILLICIFFFFGGREGSVTGASQHKAAC